MIDKTLINTVKELADKEKKINQFKKRARIKGKVHAITKTKKDNISLVIVKNEAEVRFTILKSHKERYALAESLKIGQSISAEGIPTLKIIICTKLKNLDRGIDTTKQEKLKGYLK